MSIYKEASRRKLRFTTIKGQLSVEQLWQLSVTDLDELAVELEKAYQKSDSSKSFIKVKTSADKTAKLMFDIVLDVLQTKVEEQENSLKAMETKAHNEKILGLIAKKQEASLEGLSIEELEKQLK